MDSFNLYVTAGTQYGSLLRLVVKSSKYLLKVQLMSIRIQL